MPARIIFSFLLFLVPFLPLSAQKYYKAGAGIRVGSPFSASVKYFIDDSNALEFYAGLRAINTRRWTDLGLAYQFHKDLNDIDGLQWYFGAGISLHNWAGYTEIDDNDTLPNGSIGGQLYLGLDYTFDTSPINLFIDWTPTYVGGPTPADVFDRNLFLNSGSLGIRYLFLN